MKQEKWDKLHEELDNALNTVKKNTIAGASLATNTITLPPGTYEAKAFSTIFYVERCQISLQDTSDNSILVQGISDFAANTNFDLAVCSARGFFTINTTTNNSNVITEIFNIWYEKGYIYRDWKIVNWDPKAQTTLSNEEVIRKDVQSNLY